LLQSVTQDIRIVRVLVNMVYEHSDSVKSGEFLDWVNDYQLLKTDYVPCN